MHVLYVLEDGETYSMVKPEIVVVTSKQLERIEGGEKVYSVVDEKTVPGTYKVVCFIGVEDEDAKPLSFSDAKTEMEHLSFIHPENHYELSVCTTIFELIEGGNDVPQK